MSQTKVKSGLLNFPDQTDFVKLPTGTTAQRPSSPEEGYSRYNTTDNKLEFWNGTIWQQLPGVVPPTIESVSYPGDDLAADPAGGQTITLTGTNFLDGATVDIEGTLAPVVTVVSNTEITFTAPAKTAGDYDIVLTNGDSTTATFIDGITYNGLPSWTTPAGNLGSFPAGSTIPTITLVATEPDSGVVSYSVTTGALPSGLTLTGADIDGTVPSPAGQTTYNFSVTASDDENQESTERAFNIVVYLQVTNIVSEVDPFGDSSGVVLYRFENNANDEDGVYNGTPSNVTYGAGVFGQSVVFNGSTSSYIYRNPDFLPYGNSPRAFSFWVKLDSHVEDAYFLSYGDGVSGQFFSPRITPTSQGGYISFMGYAVDYNTNVVMTTNEWMNLCYSYDGSVLSIYKNGALIGSSSLSLNTTNVRDFVVGARDFNGSITKPIDGSMDQLRVFNRAITPLEVESLYRERTVVCGGQADTLDILGDNSCIATYQLDGNANDLSSNYSGTPTNVSYGVGKFDLAGVFTESQIILPLSTSTVFSISLWFRDPIVETGWTNLFDTENHASGRFTCGMPGGTLVVYDNAYRTSSYTTSGDNLWHHLTVVKNSGVLKMYVDSNIVYDGACVSTTTLGNLKVGRYGLSAPPEAWVGGIDQIRIFNKALNSTEVTTLYNETACAALACSGTTNTLDILSDGSCIAAYPLDGSPADLSGNYNGVQTDVTYPVGKFDLGAVANGTSTRINTGYIQNGQVFSVSFWGRNFSAYGSVIRDTPAAGGANTRINIVSNANGGIALAGNYAIDPPTTGKTVWTHYVVTASGSVAKIYENTVEVASVSYSEAGGNNGTPVCMFSNGLYPVGFGEGELDQVRIFNKALSAGEVTTLYNETACN